MGAKASYLSGFHSAVLVSHWDTARVERHKGSLQFPWQGRRTSVLNKGAAPELSASSVSLHQSPKKTPGNHLTVQYQTCITTSMTGWSDSTVGKELAVFTASKGSIPGIVYGPRSTTRSKPRALPGVAQKNKPHTHKRHLRWHGTRDCSGACLLPLADLQSAPSWRPTPSRSLNPSSSSFQ